MRSFSGAVISKFTVPSDTSIADIKNQIVKKIGFKGEVLFCKDRVLDGGLLQDYCSSETVELTASRLSILECEFARWLDYGDPDG